MNHARTTVSALAAALLSGVACADTQLSCIATETFEGGTNDGGWCWNYCSAEEMDVLADGGNPGAHLATPEVLVANLPVLRTSDTVSSFTGNYAAERVQGLGIDLLVTRDVFGEASWKSIRLWSATE